jgi:hypothetical protein
VAIFSQPFDLKSGYHHVDIHAASWPYRGFTWNTVVGLLGNCTLFVSYHSASRLQASSYDHWLKGGDPEACDASFT